jgi:transposase
MWHIDLAETERLSLEAHLRTAPSTHVYLKVLAILAINAGSRVTEVAKVLHVHRITLCSWLRAYDETHDLAALNDNYHGSRPESWSDEVSAALQKTLEKPPDAWGYLSVNWTSALLREHLESQFGLDVSERTIRRCLYALNYVWKRPRVVLQDTRSPEIMRQLQLIREKVVNLPAGCAKLFEDETDIMLFPPLRAGWFPRGKAAEVPISGQNAKRTVFGTIDVENGNRILLAREGTCAVDFQALLKLIRKEYSDRKVAVLLDQASRHTAHASEGAAAELDVELIWLPAKCTNINPMDRLWRYGKDRICANKQHASIDHQADMFIQCLQDLFPQEALRAAGLLSKDFWLSSAS